ncbi:12199_t:CDS:2, partial [Acaulospora colombiana]
VNQRLKTEPALKLHARSNLSRYFATPPPERVYIDITSLLTASLVKGVKRKASAEANDDIPTKRACVLEDSLARSAPSDFSKQEKYKRLDPNKFAFNRPPVPQSIPLAILHSIFGQFVEETESYEPTMEDYALVRGLRMAMSTVNGYSTEPQYCEEFRTVLHQHYPDVQLRASAIGSTKFISDGHLQVGKYMSSVCEAKLWDGKGDPEIQACGYMIASLRHMVNRSEDYPDKFPCMIISIF